MSSSLEASTSFLQQNEPMIEELVLDAGPLVTQQRLIGLAKKFYIPASVVNELRDKNARDHFARLQEQSDQGSGGNGGYSIEICEPNAEAMLAVMKFAKQTGDYSVLSQPDLNVLALTYYLEVKKHGQWRIRDKVGGPTGQQKQSQEQKQQTQTTKESKGKENNRRVNDTTAQASEAKQDSDTIASKNESGEAEEKVLEASINANDSDLNDVQAELAATSIGDTSDHNEELQESGVVEESEKDEGDEEDLDDDEDDEETGGEWITPDNIDKHKSRALGLVSESDLSLMQNATKSKSNGRMRTVITESESDQGWSTVTTRNTIQKSGQPSANRASLSSKSSNKSSGPKKITVACMTGDYAVQNVLLQMGLYLVGLEGTRIRQVKSWVLRCHACFKICKDSEKKFCPQCGNPTLLRTSVTSTDPQAAATGNGGVQIHLKKNFQYKNRGTKFSLPLPKPGKAGGKPEKQVPILREDQAEWQKALSRDKVQKSKQERSLQRALERGSDSLSARYEDADTLSILLAGKTSGNAYQGLPQIGVGRRNPNEKHRRKV